MIAERKNELLRRVTDLLVKVEGQDDPQFRQFVQIRTGEYSPGQWSLDSVQPTAVMTVAKFAAVRRGGFLE